MRWWQEGPGSERAGPASALGCDGAQVGTGLSIPPLSQNGMEEKQGPNWWGGRVGSRPAPGSLQSGASSRGTFWLWKDCLSRCDQQELSDGWEEGDGDLELVGLRREPCFP